MIIQHVRYESGNVLFLILIAVALFAALSYVVTNSTRSGGGSTEREKSVLSSAQMTQYPTSLRTALLRMTLGGAGVENIKFNVPGSFSGSVINEVFHPQGGGATYQTAAKDLMDSTSAAGTWTFNANFEVNGLGLDDMSGGNEIIAFLPSIGAAVCRQVNERLGVSKGSCTTSADAAVPDLATALQASRIDQQMATGYTFPTTDQPDLECQGGTAFTRQASGCFRDTANNRFVFYSVLMER